MSFFKPSHPGELLRMSIAGLRKTTGEKLLLDEVASGLGTTRQTLSAILNERQSVTPEMALRLAAAFRNTTPEFWLDLQQQYDLARVRETVSTDNVRIFWDPVAA